MRVSEKFIMLVAVVVFITALGHGVFDVYVTDFEEGIDVLLEVGEHSTQAIIAAGALIAAAVTVLNSTRGKKKRK